MKIKPKNWDSFQQYKDRKPQWIKLHRDLLNSFSYASVQIGTKATAPLLWLLCSEYENGVIDASLEEISFRIHIDKDTVNKAIVELIDKEFFISLDESVQDCTEEYKNVPREEKRRDREETEKEQSVVAIQESDTMIEARQVAFYLHEKILTVKANFKSNPESWVKDIELAIRLDARHKEHLIRCIDWIYSAKGSFWQSNILSGKKLRAKYDQMELQAQRKDTSKNSPMAIYQTGKTATEMIKEMTERELNAS